MSNLIKKRVKDSLTNNTPEIDFDYILQECHKIDEERSIVVEKKKKFSWPKFMPVMAMACIAIIAFIGLNTNNSQPQFLMTVGLDVNPSITMDINDDGTVISVTARNEEAKEVLEGLELVDIDATKAANTIVDSMSEHGYIIEDSSILFSVEGVTTLNDKQQELADKINQSLIENSNSTVLFQVVKSDAALQELANEYDISIGKAQLINDLITADPTLTFDTLASLSIQELAVLTVNGNRTFNDNVKISNTVNTSKYIGEDAAYAAAVKYAGIKESAILEKEIDFDYEDGKMVYEVELEISKGSHTIDIDAVTGQLVHSRYDANDDDDNDDNDSDDSDKDDNNDDDNDNDDQDDDDDYDNNNDHQNNNDDNDQDDVDNDDQNDDNDDNDDLYDDVDDNDDEQDDQDDQDDQNEENDLDDDNDDNDDN